ncbi:alpha/beta hydrolase [Henriciella litoralis]|uniref:alpha/beta hydrolase n=1 Tax=Henriciella litoralis TaxID=568102 RepID=UPI000A078ABE|nr:alpha/beta hydrolase [Henriciella litoralis]
MAELIIPGPAGRIEARYTKPPQEGSPIALILHPHPRAGGTMQDPITIRLFQMFEKRGFGVLRFNTRGVGRSQGVYDQGVGELEDAAYVLDYMENLTESPRFVWCAGYSFGAWITLQLLMRRPEIDGFLAIAPPCNHYDLSFLAPCPASGLILSGDNDKISGPKDVERALTKVRVQKGEVIERDTITGANHFFQGKQDELLAKCETYVDRRLVEDEQKMRLETDTSKKRGMAALPNVTDDDEDEGDIDSED